MGEISVRIQLPRVDELTDAIGNQKAKYFSTLDVMRGYHQVKMEDKSKENTASWLFQYIIWLFKCASNPSKVNGY